MEELILNSDILFEITSLLPPLSLYNLSIINKTFFKKVDISNIGNKIIKIIYQEIEKIFEDKYLEFIDILEKSDIFIEERFINHDFNRNLDLFGFGGNCYVSKFLLKNCKSYIIKGTRRHKIHEYTLFNNKKITIFNYKHWYDQSRYNDKFIFRNKELLKANFIY
jgi:hypothetical protein